MRILMIQLHYFPVSLLLDFQFLFLFLWLDYLLVLIGDEGCAFRFGTFLLVGINGLWIIGLGI